MSEIKIGIADLNIAKNGDSLVTYALGSCVGICLYDGVRKVAGLSHIMLPSIVDFPGSNQVYKFADSAVPELIRKMEFAGAKKICMKAKIAGGAKMFATTGNSSLSNIGDRNVIAVKQALMKAGIQIIAEDTGKNYGRTQYFDSTTGKMRIKSATKGEWTY